MHPLLTALSLGFALLLGCGAAQAQSFPSRPVRIIVPSTPGGAADLLARLLGQKMSEAFGQPVVVDNRPGAGNIIGTDAVAKAAPDGHTILMAINNHAINASLYKKLPYDPIKDFAAVSLVVSTPHILVVHPSLPVKSVQDLIRLARSQPGKIHYASAGNGTAAHFAAELFNSAANVQLTHVPYKGLGGAMNDTLAGTVQVIFPSPLTALPQVRAGKLIALAVTTPVRSKALPELPTLQESGVPGYQFDSWYGLLAPRGTPEPIVARLHQGVTQALQSKDLLARLATEAADPVGSTPRQFQQFLLDEAEKYAKLIKELGIQAD
jgi:tripartite-type tricarboxylate transporter receptor subunit TctC